MKYCDRLEEGYYWATTKRTPNGTRSGYRTIVRVYTYDRRWYVQIHGEDKKDRIDEFKDFNGPITE